MNFSLRGKLIAGFLTASAFAMIIGLVSTVLVNKLLEANNDLAANYLPSIDAVWRASEAQTRVGRASRSVAQFSVNADQMGRYIDEYTKGISDIEAAVKVYETLATSAEEKALLVKFREKYAAWRGLQDQYVPLWNEKKDALVKGLRERDLTAFVELHDRMNDKQSQIRASFDELDQVFVDLTATNKALSEKASKEAEASGNMGRIIMMVVVLLGVTASISIGLYIAGSTLKLLGVDPSEISDVVKQVTAGDTNITMRNEINFGVYSDIKAMVNGLNEKAASAELISKGDLTSEVRMVSEKDRLGKAFQTMISVLRDIISRANSASQQVATGSTQVSGASQSLSQGATEQASSVEEISSSVTEISSKIKANASNAAAASEIAVQAQAAAEQGNRQIEVTLQAMNDINVSSQEISKIIKVIDDIAFQTNLLALNAAVEAARAGRHGKGFAVVADEVRNLAGRSAKAAKETTELIESSSRKVDSGLNEARRTAESFQEIVRNSIKVSDIITQISSASNDQAAGISQIAAGVNQINKVTQQTTANAEETAAAAEELASQAEELKRSLAYFHIGRESQSRDPKPVTKRVVNIRPQSGDSWGSGPEHKDVDHGHHDNNSLDDRDFGKYGT